MAYIYRRGKTFWASYWRNGKRVRVSCGTGDKKRSAAILEDLKAGAKAAPTAGRAVLSVLNALNIPVPPEANPETLLMAALLARAHPNDLTAAVRERLRVWSEQAAANPREAARLETFRRELGAVVANEQTARLPLGDVLEAFRAAPRRKQIRPATLEAFHAPVWKRFREWAEGRGRTYLHEISEGDALEYMAHLQTEKLSSASRRNARSALRAIWNALRVQAGLSANPWKATPAPEAEQSHRRALTPAEIKKLFAAASDPEDRAALGLGLFAALRLGDSCCLTWGAVDFRGRVLRVTQSKTGRTLAIPMHPFLSGLLRALGPGKPSEPVCPTLSALYSQNRAEASERMAKIFTAAGLETAEAAGEDEIRLRAHSVGAFHRLRHSFASLAAVNGAPPVAVAAVTGHRTVDVLENYTHTDLEAARRAVRAIPAPGKRRASPK